MELFNYFVFVIMPIFILGFQALLLPILFFLKARNWLQGRAFLLSGAIAGTAFGYLFAHVGGAQQYLALVVVVVGLFGALSASFWWYVLVKRPATSSEHQ